MPETIGFYTNHSPDNPLNHKPFNKDKYQQCITWMIQFAAHELQEPIFQTIGIGSFPIVLLTTALAGVLLRKGNF